MSLLWHGVLEVSHQLVGFEEGPATGGSYGYEVSEGVVKRSVKLAMSDPSAINESKKGDDNSGKLVSLNKLHSHSGARDGLPRKMLDLGSANSIRDKLNLYMARHRP